MCVQKANIAKVLIFKVKCDKLPVYLIYINALGCLAESEMLGLMHTYLCIPEWLLWLLTGHIKCIIRWWKTSVPSYFYIWYIESPPEYLQEKILRILKQWQRTHCWFYLPISSPPFSKEPIIFVSRWCMGAYLSAYSARIASTVVKASA